MEILENRDAWLAELEQTGDVDFSIYNRPRNQSVPPGEGIDLSKSRLMLISSAGSYLRQSQAPFDAANDLGDYTVRTFPAQTPFEALDYAHDHYDQTAVRSDPQVLLPLRHLADMVERGIIGELAPVTSFMGYQPDATHVVDELIPAIVPPSFHAARHWASHTIAHSSLVFWMRPWRCWPMTHLWIT